MYKIKFGTDGWRAIIAKEFTVENVARVTEGTALWMKKNFKNPFDRNNVLKIKGKEMLFHEYVELAKSKGNKTIPCNCPHHDDKEPSAHISINKYGDFMFCCTPCGITQYCSI